ncbi:hypothetical protein F5Y10DRAFT_233753 [Nemania abortiva]|nr:hypothetical protein F5Y10DRAFT_233753 [Nemania abortiva]
MSTEEIGVHWLSLSLSLSLSDSTLDQRCLRAWIALCFIIFYFVIAGLISSLLACEPSLMFEASISHFMPEVRVVIVWGLGGCSNHTVFLSKLKRKKRTWSLEQASRLDRRELPFSIERATSAALD